MIIRESTPKARKDHQCNFCGGTIKKGESYQNDVIVGESNDVYNWKSHFQCTELVEKLKMHESYGDGYLSE